MCTIVEKSIILLLSLCCVNAVPRQHLTSTNDIENYWRYESQTTTAAAAEKVRVDLFYEALCPDCIREYPQFPPLIKKLGYSVDVRTYPYGNAMMYQKDGQTVVECQHGPAECYGNKLHACAIDILQDVNSWVNYNACLMNKRSNDSAADECGQLLNVDSAPIKECAKGQRGQNLLIAYGLLSGAVHKFGGVPYVRVNGKDKPDDQAVWDAVCEAFVNPPGITNETIEIKVYYESLCPFCRQFLINQLGPAVEKLGNYLSVHLYPYGNAKTKLLSNAFEVKCQHGPPECYGNKLHACALQLLGFHDALPLINCLMDLRQDKGSDDDSLNECGKSIPVKIEPIKECAQGIEGHILHLYHGEQTSKVHQQYVPHVLINGVNHGVDNFFQNVCKEFEKPPNVCNLIN